MTAGLAGNINIFFGQTLTFPANNNGSKNSSEKDADQHHQINEKLNESKDPVPDRKIS
ncbi:hypothetical protein CCP2SC5_300025 [Azospirillaceae bacterium]